VAPLIGAESAGSGWQGGQGLIPAADDGGCGLVGRVLEALADEVLDGEQGREAVKALSTLVDMIETNSCSTT
jgi:hypothetical protein